MTRGQEAAAIYDEVVEDVFALVSTLERRGPVDRRRIAFRVTQEEFNLMKVYLSQTAANYQAHREYLDLTGLHIIGVKIIPDFTP